MQENKGNNVSVESYMSLSFIEVKGAFVLNINKCLNTCTEGFVSKIKGSVCGVVKECVL